MDVEGERRGEHTRHSRCLIQVLVCRKRSLDEKKIFTVYCLWILSINCNGRGSGALWTRSLELTKKEDL